MAKNFLTPINLNKNELQNAAVQNLASAPSAPVKGQMYFNSTGGDNTLYWWDGTAWIAAKAPSTSGITQGEGDARYVQLNGSTMTGLLLLSADPGAPLGAATKQYVDTHLTQAEADPLYVNVNGDTMTNFLTLHADPTATLHAATKQYVDNMSQGLSWKDSVRVATTANGTLASAFQNGASVDGVSLVTGNRILLKNQTAPAENGVYTVNASGAPTRATDADSAGELDGTAVFVQEGTTQQDTAWVLTTNPPITIGTTGLTFAQFGAGATYAAGAGLTLTTNTFDVVADTTITVTADLISRAALTGNVTAPAGSNATTIAAGVVANSMLSTMPANTIKMNNTAGTASPTDVTVAAAKTALGVPSALPVGIGEGGTGRVTGGTAYGLIAAGTTAVSVQQTVAPAASGFLKTTSTSALPAWAAITTADITGLDTTLTGKAGKFTQATIGGATSQVVTHNLNTQAVVVDVYRTLTPWDTVECDIERTTVNTITLRFAAAPSTNEYSVVVIG